MNARKARLKVCVMSPGADPARRSTTAPSLEHHDAKDPSQSVRFGTVHQEDHPRRCASRDPDELELRAMMTRSADVAHHVFQQPGHRHCHRLHLSLK